jgi:hypothetical protein
MYLLSSMICGLLIGVGWCYFLFDSYGVSSASLSVQYWYHWVNWLPGIVFGLVFSTLHSTKGLNILIFSLVSGVVLLLAGLIKIYVQISGSGYTEWGIIVGSVFGGLALSLSVNILVQTKLNLETVFKPILISFLSGGVLAFCYYFLNLAVALAGGGSEIACTGNQPLVVETIPASILTFAVWQVPVGLALSAIINKQTENQTQT